MSDVSEHLLKVLLQSQWLFVIVAVAVLCPGHVAGQFTAAPPTCPGDTLTFRCNVTGGMNGVTIWRVGGSSECSALTHRSTSSSSACGPSNAFRARPRAGFGTSGPTYSSTLSGNAISTLNDILVECFGPANNVDSGNRVGNSTLQILGPPSVATLSCVGLSEDVSGTVNVTMSWTLSGGDNADFYLINITTNAPQTPYGGLLNITTGSVTQYELTGFMTGYEYNITVRGVTANCGGLVGRESEPLMITPQVPATPIPKVCAAYNEMNRALQVIETTLNELDNVTISEDCANGQNIRAIYELSYATDSGVHITTCVVDGTECSNGTCHHELQSNAADSRCQPPVSRFSGESVTVSVIARNIVGRSNSAVSRSLIATDLEVRIDTTNLSNAFVMCTLNQPGYNCTIEYGTDPSYTNLVYRDTSSTMGRMVTITLSQRLREDTTYYYVVSAESSSQCLRVWGRIQTECTVTDLGITPQGGTVDPRCTETGFVSGSSISGGVVCYNGTTVGSWAVYICNESYNLMGNETRVCQSDGSWNGSMPKCMPEERGQTDLIVGLAVGVGGVLLIVIVAILVLLWMNNKRKKIRQAKTIHSAASQNDVDRVAFFVSKGCINSKDVNGMTALHVAAEEGHIYVVKHLVDQNADTKVKDNNGRTPLHIAASKKFENVVEYLVGNVADISIKDNTGMTPLHVAAEAGSQDIVECLVGKGVNINIKDNNERTPVYVAAGEGHINLVKYLVDEREADINITEKFGRTPVYMAAERGHKEIVEYLVGEKKADITIKDKSGRTPVYMAAEEGHLDIVKYLVDKERADIHIKDNYERTPVYMAAQKGRTEIVRYLVDEKQADIATLKKTGVYIAAEGGHIDLVKYLVDEQKADIRIKGSYERTPLHMAAINGHTNIVEYLIQKGAPIDIRDCSGWAPLHMAANGGHYETVQCLAIKGAYINIEANDGSTPCKLAAVKGHTTIAEYLAEKESSIKKEATDLHTAAKRCDMNTVKTLIGEEADVNAKDNDGMTPLHMAAKRGCLEIVRYLIDQGAAVNIKDDNGWTPLHIAVKEGQEFTVEILVDKGADVKIHDKCGMTPLHVAAKTGGRCKILSYLVDRGASINIQDTDSKQTPLHIAAREGQEITVQTLVDNEADVKIHDKYGMTPLHVAAETGGRSRIINYLVDRGANINIQDIHSQQTPLHIAAKEGQEITVKTLVDKSADVNICDKYERTPLQVAAKRGHEKIEKILRGVAQAARLEVEEAEEQSEQNETHAYTHTPQDGMQETHL